MTQRGRSGLITGIIFGLVLLLCGGGAVGVFSLVTNLEGHGAATPTVAVDTFLRGIYVDLDADEAGKVACREIPAEQIKSEIAAVRSFQKSSPGGAFTWGPPTEKSRTGEKAVYAVTISYTGGTRATQHGLQLQAVSNGGWRVCDVQRLA